MSDSGCMLDLCILKENVLKIWFFKILILCYDKNLECIKRKCEKSAANFKKNSPCVLLIKVQIIKNLKKERLLTYMTTKQKL